jgi:hypothetical protein
MITEKAADLIRAVVGHVPTLSASAATASTR